MYTERQQSDPQSFFQVGGIHGLPYTPWEGATVDPPVNAENQWAGYCFHSSVLFPTWHRPYIALFEVVLSALFIFRFLDCSLAASSVDSRPRGRRDLHR